jgi:hypothetical protein
MSEGEKNEAAGHTPGPWVARVKICHETASEHFAVEAPEHDGPCPCGGKHPKGRLIAWLSGGGRVWHDRVAPDARLIAAAPDLLAELLAADEIIRKLCEAVVKFVPVSDTVNFVDVRVPERAAVLAKAGSR